MTQTYMDKNQLDIITWLKISYIKAAQIFVVLKLMDRKRVDVGNRNYSSKPRTRPELTPQKHRNLLANLASFSAICFTKVHETFLEL